MDGNITGTFYKDVELVRFGIVDYVALVTTLTVSLAVGLYYACTGNKRNTTSEYFLADRSMSFFPVTFSLLATFVSATTFLGVTSEVYTFGSQHTFLVVGCFMLFPTVSYFFLPVFYDLGITSVNEYLEKRFNRLIRKLASGLYISQMMMFLAPVIHSSALALGQATGLHFWGCTGIIISICTVYTAVGGIKAVIWAEVMQFFTMVIVFITIMIKGCFDSGGFESVWMTAMKGKRLEFFNYDLDPKIRHTMWTQSLGFFFATLPIYAINQSQIQRCLSARSLSVARKALWANLAVWIWITASCGMMGFIIFTYYHNCDPASAGIIERNDQLLPLFAMDVLSHIPGFSGMFIAGLIGLSLSTLSACLNSLAAVTYEDFVKSFLSGKISEAKEPLVVKSLAFGYGLQCLLGIGFVAQFSTNSEAALTPLGLLGGPILGIFILGMFFPWTNSWGAGFGALAGLVMSVWIKVGVIVTKPVAKRLPVTVAGCLANFTTSTLAANYNATSPLTANDTYSTTSFMLDNYTSLFRPGSIISTPSSTIGDVFSTPMTETNTNPLISLYSISYMWYSLISCSLTIFIGLIVSFITGPKRASEIDSKLFSPLAKFVMNKIPENWKLRLRCDLVEETASDKMRNGHADSLLGNSALVEETSKC